MTSDLHVVGSEAWLVAGDLTLRLDLRHGARVVAVETAAQPGRSLVDRWWCGYTADGERWSDAPQERERAFATGRARVRRSGRPEVVAQVVSPHLRVAKRFTVYPELPFVRIRYRIETTGVEGRGPGLSLGLPAIQFSDLLADPFDLREATADDGTDFGGGLALPAWRAFGDPHDCSVLLAATQCGAVLVQTGFGSYAPHAGTHNLAARPAHNND